MFYTEWETPLTENDESSDNTKILQSVPTLPKEFELHPHDFNHNNGTVQTNEPSTYPPPPQFSNHNPSTENGIDVTNITPKSSSAPISTNQSVILVKRNRKYFAATWESLLVFLSTFSPCSQFPVDYSIIQTNLDRHVEPHPFTLMAQGSISMTAS